MNQEIKAKWVAALRSGEYTQTKKKLKDDGGYCCLGVLCEVSKKDGGIGIEQNLSDTHGDQSIGLTIREWAGLTSTEGGQVTISMKRDFLTSHNDSGRTFLEIADAIEKQL